jgi:RHS repeat-associated protein
MRAVTVLAFTCGVCWSSGIAAQVGDVSDQFFRYFEVNNRLIEPHLPGETVDHFTGNLSIVQEDMAFPGKAGLDLRIVRTYSSKIWGRSDLLTGEPLLADKEESPVGFGWTMHMGRVRSPNTTGQNPVYESFEGPAHTFYPLSTGADLISRDSWQYTKDWQRCSGASSGQGVCITTTSGLRYEFDAANQYFIGTTLVFPLSAVVDPFGNRITVTYQPGGSTFGGSTGRIDHITDTYNRVVTFTYTSCGSRTCLQSITAGPSAAPRKVTYTYTLSSGQGGAGHYALPSPQRAFLTAVQPASGAGYTYDYGYGKPVANNQYALTSITYPYGGNTTYSYDTTQFFTGCDSGGVPMPVVTNRTISGQSLLPSVWTYSYTSPNNAGFQTQIETRPDNKQNIYELYGFGFAAGTHATGSIWRVGLMYRITRDAAPTGPGHGAEVELLEWSPGAAIAAGPEIYRAPSYGGNCPNWAWDDVLQSPVMTKHTVTRDSSSYETDLSGHDQFGQPTTITEKGEVQRTTTYKYDPPDPSTNQAIGRITLEKVCDASACYQNTRTFAGPHHRLDTETLRGITTSFTYDPTDGDIKTVTLRPTSSKTVVLTLSAYSNGLPTNIDLAGKFQIIRTVNWDGRVATETNARGDVTTYAYDTAGRLHQITLPNGGDQRTYCHNITPATSTTVPYEDSYAIRHTAFSSAAPDSICALAQTNPTILFWERTNLDGLGRTIWLDNSLNERQLRDFDALGRLIFSSYALKTGDPEVGEEYDYDSLGRRTLTSLRFLATHHVPLLGQCTNVTECTTAAASFDDSQHCRSVTLKRGPGDSTVNQYCFQSHGDPTKEQLAKVIDGNLKNWTLSYDVAGNVKKLTAPLSGGDRSFSFDPNTFLLSSEQSGPRGTITTPSYNDIGQPLTRIDPRPVTTTLIYDDPLSRLTSTQYASASTENVSRSYDRDVLQTMSSINGGNYSYLYDEMNRVTTQTWVFQGRTYTTTYHFDHSGCLDRLIYPTGTELSLACDAKNRTTTVNARLAGASAFDSIATNIDYHPGGIFHSMTLGNGIIETTTVENGRIKSITAGGGGSSVNVLNLSYAFDGANNVTSITDGVNSANSVTNITYDNLDRLTNVHMQSGSAIAYDYDDLGNRRKITPNFGSPTEFVYDDKNTNRLVSSTGPSALQVGKLSWSAAERLETSSDGTSYQYNGSGQRVLKSRSPTEVTLYHYDSLGRVIAETRPNGDKLRDYIYAGDQLVAVDGCISSETPPCNGREWYHIDIVGTVVARTDRTGAATIRLTYLPWGEFLTPSTPGRGTRLYNNRFIDEATSAYDYGARTYSPALGRFLGGDPVWRLQSNPQNLNLYAYTLNNPFKHTDPTGKGAKELFAQIRAWAGFTKETSEQVAKKYEKVEKNAEAASQVLDFAGAKDASKDAKEVAESFGKAGKAAGKVKEVAKVAEDVAEVGEAWNEIPADLRADTVESGRTIDKFFKAVGDKLGKYLPNGPWKPLLSDLPKEAANQKFFETMGELGQRNSGYGNLQAHFDAHGELVPNQ